MVRQSQDVWSDCCHDWGHIQIREAVISSGQMRQLRTGRVRNRGTMNTQHGTSYLIQTTRRYAITLSLLVLMLLPASLSEAFGQDKPRDAWSAGVEILKSVAPERSGTNTTVVGRQPAADEDSGGDTELRLVALLTADGQQIDQGLIWRVFKTPEGSRKSKLLGEYREASPSVSLKPGDYTVNAAFGRAHITRRIKVKAEQNVTEQFVLNAGGLRLRANYENKKAPDAMVRYAIYVDDREQFTSPNLVMSSVKPELIIRLNAGLYRIVSRFGDANAKVEAEVTVEAGKLSETTITHVAGRAAFKLVTRPGGEALPDTVWTIKYTDGTVVRETVGALPSHYLKPGSYLVSAKSAGQVFSKEFEVRDGKTTNVEVLRNDNALASPAPAKQETAKFPASGNGGFSISPGFSLDDEALVPSLGIKNQ